MATVAEIDEYLLAGRFRIGIVRRCVAPESRSCLRASDCEPCFGRCVFKCRNKPTSRSGERLCRFRRSAIDLSEGRCYSYACGDSGE